jgi:hypothetical protein
VKYESFIPCKGQLRFFEPSLCDTGTKRESKRGEAPL